MFTRRSWEIISFRSVKIECDPMSSHSRSIFSATSVVFPAISINFKTKNKSRSSLVYHLLLHNTVKKDINIGLIGFGTKLTFYLSSSTVLGSDPIPSGFVTVKYS